MAGIDFNKEATENIISEYIEKIRPPLKIRDKLDIGYKIKGKEFEIFEIRPSIQNPKKLSEGSVIKAKYLNKKWKIYWKRADLMWHIYKPNPEVKTIEEIIEIMEKDQYGCFWG